MLNQQIFSIGTEIPFLGKFDPNKQNCLIKMKFGIYTNSNMLNLMMMFICFAMELKYSF